MRDLRFGLRLPWWSVVVAFTATRASPAQAVACPVPRIDPAAASSQWAPPLDRVLTLHSAELSLRDALDRVAATARLRVSYSADLLPLNRAVCLSANGEPAGSVLAGLLAGTNVTAVGVGGNQVVLTPRRDAPAEHPSEESMASSLGVLDRVVVTGSATTTGGPERGLSVGITVLDGRQLARDRTSALSSALDEYVPGVWGWAQSPSSMISSYASIRGASSFGLSYPKVYIDGIEVANPLLLSRFNPTAVDHIEVIRGPQGSALYGTDAISGVINIVTLHEGVPADGARTTLRSNIGLAQSNVRLGGRQGAFGNDVLRQEHSLSIASGTSTQSANLNVSVGSIGSFIPDGYSRDLMASGSARKVGQAGTLSGTARLFVERAGTPSSPLVGSTAPGTDDTTTVPQAVTEYTLGASGTRILDSTWTASFVAGIDGYRLSNVQTDFTPIKNMLDSALHAAEGGADRATLRLSSVHELTHSDRNRATLTVALEHATLRVATLQAQTAVSVSDDYGGGDGSNGGSNGSGSNSGSSGNSSHVSAVDATSPTRRVVSWQNSTGLVAQSNVELNNTFFLTGGVRFEHDSRLALSDAVEVLPMLGASAVGGRGPFTVKLRAAYGKGIRPPATPSRLQFWQAHDAIIVQNALGPERQSGIEGGIDLFVTRAFSFQVTRFDQKASGLAQLVGVPIDSDRRPRRFVNIAQNVGEISNRGWELQSTGNFGRLSLNGTLSLVDSRVRKLATGYGGDLTPGDRMLQVPARTESITAAWNARRWNVSLGASRALDWINYDEQRLSTAWATDSQPSQMLTGPLLRQYWMHYDGGTRLRASAARALMRGWAFEISGENLLNHQVGEPDNVTIVPGRTLMTGLRLRF